MESVVLLGLMGVGYLMNKDKEEKHTTHPEVQPPVVLGSGNSVYDQANYVDSKKYEIDMVTKHHDLAMQGDSKVIDHLNMGGRNTLRDKDVFSDSIKSISGVEIPKEEFLVNDQGIKSEPFFSGNGPANINYDDNQALMNHQGGSQAFRPPKREIGQFFELQKDLGNVFGNQFDGARADQSRYIGSTERRNELPFEQEMVAPIDDKSEVNRDIDLAYAQRNSVDAIRTLNNMKESYGGKILGGKGIDHRGLEGEVFQHKPDADYVNTADRWLVTTGAIEAPMIQPEEVVKETNRAYFNEGKMGPAGAVNFNPSESRPNFKRSTNQQLNIDSNRNMNLEDKAIDDDHNKGSYFAYPNEREITEERTYEGNIKSVFQGETERLYDSVRPTVKQTTLDSDRNGFVGSSITTVPEERLQDSVRATKKQTTNYEYNGNAGSYLPGSMSNDQFYRADLNPNKEIISQGREPTPVNTKLSNGVDILNVDIKKIENDYFNPRINNLDKVYQEIPTDNTCEYTQEKDTLDNVKLADRLDPVMLDPFKDNPYTHSLASFAY
uniref:Uncharacterized protein n=1 Tax=viral metagenome TaxID=1070528 RepID=A0A6C0FER6_9ZZZZ|tara:strand:+ start:4275 stop:5927 length:1653 start_codon:yes stop_codon:yes gene_type:complete